MGIHAQCKQSHCCYRTLWNAYLDFQGQKSFLSQKLRGKVGNQKMRKMGDEIWRWVLLIRRKGS